MLLTQTLGRGLHEHTSPLEPLETLQNIQEGQDVRWGSAHFHLEGMEDTCHSLRPTPRSSPNTPHSKVPQILCNGLPSPPIFLEALHRCPSHLGT